MRNEPELPLIVTLAELVSDCFTHLSFTYDSMREDDVDGEDLQIVGDVNQVSTTSEAAKSG